MKKLIILVCIILLFATSCDMSRSSTSIIDSMKITSSFVNGSMDISDATTLGISIKTNNRGVGESGTMEIPYLVKDDGSGLYDEVKIKDPNEEYYLNEGDLGVEVYKFQTLDGYTVVSYISSKIRENLTTSEYKYSEGNQSFSLAYFNSIETTQGLDYEQWNKYPWSETCLFDITQGVPLNFYNVAYVNSDFVKTYIIDNSTGKIYSTEIFPIFDIVEGMIAVRRSAGYYNYTFYTLKTVNGELQLKEVISNPDIVASWIYRDKDGWIYVGNNVYEGIDRENKTTYLKSGCVHDNKGTLYELGSLYPKMGASYPKYIFKNGGKELVDYPAAHIEGIEGPDSLVSESYGCEIYAVINGIVVRNMRACGASGSVIGIKITGEDDAISIYYTDRSTCNYWLDDTCTLLYRVKDGEVRWQKIDWDMATDSTSISADYSDPILSDVELYGDYYLMVDNQIVKYENALRKVNLSGTEYYYLRWNETENVLEPVLLLQTTTKSKVFSIKELK